MKNPWKISTVVLAMLLGFVLKTPSFQNQAIADAQPAMKEALEHLTKAKNFLEKANTDKGGHRAKALKLTKEAIEQVEKGIEYDNKH